MLGGLLALALVAPGATGASTTLTVSAGTDSVGGHVQLNTFAPTTVHIAAGDTITWRVDSTEFHTIHFLGGATPPPFVTPGPDGVFFNPAVIEPSGGASYDGTGSAGSGLLTKGETYSLSFPRAGTYDYVCLVHPQMKGQVVVDASGQGADSQATVDARRTAEVNADLAQRGIAVLMSNVGELPAEGASAGIAAGAGDHVVMVPRFLPERVTVKAGDAITWIWKDPEIPHTVTFLGGEQPPEVVVPQPRPDGPPRLQLNPAVLQPSGDPTGYAGGPLNSGFLDPSLLPPGSGAPTFTVRFTEPGTYDYVCLLHENMQGTVVVEA